MNQNRREFLKITSAITGLPLIQSLQEEMGKHFSSPKQGYRLLIMGTDWGYAGNRDQLCAAVKKEGYDGIETWWPGDDKAQKELFDALKKYNLQVGFLCGGWQKDPKEHLGIFKKNIDAAVANPYQKPVYINCHSGKDYFTYEQNKPFIDHTTQLSKQSGVPIYHETHRGRMLFASPAARNFIEKNPALRLTLDISHWCAVHESLLADQEETVNIALDRADHVHARIGHAEGPQVNDPRAPEWEAVVKTHLAWWDKIVERKKKNGELMTFLTEFGPADYLPTLPYTRQPVASQWDINVFMLQLLRKRYQ